MATTYFTEDHEWIRVDGGIATVGITDYAQEQLGDLVFVELPEVGRAREEGRHGGGRRIRQGGIRRLCAGRRRDHRGQRQRCRRSRRWSIRRATGDGWLWKMKLADESQLVGLLDEAGYKALIG